jgi:guanine deaminase
MCLGAIYWADIRNIYYCAGQADAERIGFMDRHLYEEFARPEREREMRSTPIPLQEMDRLLEEWNNMKDRTLY